MGVGLERLQELVKMRTAMVVLRDLHDPRVRLVTITRVKLDRDLEVCRVYWSTLAEGGARSAVVHALEDARGYVQREVAKVLKTRKVPRLEWVFDESIEGIDRVARLLRVARDEDEARARARGDSAAGDSPAATAGSDADSDDADADDADSDDADSDDADSDDADSDDADSDDADDADDELPRKRP